MALNLTASEQLTYCTVRIECSLLSGGQSTGTGFFFDFLRSASDHIPAIVTNKHVIADSQKAVIHFHLSDANGQLIQDQNLPVTFDSFQSRWIPHPDSTVDLCIMPIAPLVNKLVTEVKNLFVISLDKTLIPTDNDLAELTALEEIIMVGYPNGIWDRVNNMPIIRKGITATHPNLNYNGKQEFMIDAACFPGSSGSPVFLFNAGSYAGRKGVIIMGSRVKLLGVLYAGPQHTAEGEVEIVNVPIQQRVVAFSRIPNNLGVVIKASKLLDFEPILEKLRLSTGGKTG